jgi:hypothetical protein
VQNDFPPVSTCSFDYGKTDRLQRWKKDDDSPSKNSFSLHIASYENSVKNDDEITPNVPQKASKITEVIFFTKIPKAVQNYRQCLVYP